MIALIIIIIFIIVLLLLLLLLLLSYYYCFNYYFHNYYYCFYNNYFLLLFFIIIIIIIITIIIIIIIIIFILSLSFSLVFTLQLSLLSLLSQSLSLLLSLSLSLLLETLSQSHTDYKFAQAGKFYNYELKPLKILNDVIVLYVLKNLCKFLACTCYIAASLTLPSSCFSTHPNYLSVTNLILSSLFISMYSSCMSFSKLTRSPIPSLQKVSQLFESFFFAFFCIFFNSHKISCIYISFVLSLTYSTKSFQQGYLFCFLKTLASILYTSSSLIVFFLNKFCL